MEVREVNEFTKSLGHIPLVDVRSPAEFEHGHITEAINIPMFSDEERAQVGTKYKQKGRIPAIEKGLEIIGPKMLDLANRAQEVAREGSLRVYCWRGGMRSEKMAWLFELVGLKCFVLKGGFKAYRNRLLEDFRNIKDLIVLQGPTGTGKTEILQNLKYKGEQVLDLEGLANHRGSAFGDIGMGRQPSSMQFQNDLHFELSRMDLDKRIWVEGESLTIGKVYLPETLWEKMNNTLIIELILPKPIRIQRLVDEYGHYGKEILASATRKIEKRFGGNRVKQVTDFLNTNQLHKAAGLLLDYYDKSYSHSQKMYKNQSPVRIESKNIEAGINAGILINEIDRLIEINE